MRPLGWLARSQRGEIIENAYFYGSYTVLSTGSQYGKGQCLNVEKNAMSVGFELAVNRSSGRRKGPGTGSVQLPVILTQVVLNLIQET